MEFDFIYLYEVMPRLSRASGVTLFATITGMTIAMAMGLVWSLFRHSGIPVVSEVIGGIVEFVRITPLLVQLFFVFYVLPLYGVTLPPLATGIGVIGLHYSTYLSEVYRSGITSVPREQWEAITALNMSPLAGMRRIILPQAVVPMIPTFGNYFIEMLKNTSLLSAITIPELVSVGKTISFFNFKYLEIFTAIGVIYFVLSYLAAWIFRWIENRFRIPN